MIVKRVTVARSALAKSKAVHVRNLCNYIDGRGAGRDGEKVEHRGSVNLLNVEHDEQVQEIVDLAEMARRSPRPVQHWIFSWPDGEQPTAEQADGVVRIFLGEMGFGRHQGLYALHRDTDNWHLHLAVNRVHPESEKIVTVNRGFDLEVAHRALARIEHAHGWARERLGRYRVTGSGDMERATSARNRNAQPSGPVRDGEIRSGKKSAQRIAIEKAAPILRKARSWRELHGELAKQGMRIEAKGSGAVLWVGAIPVKASIAGRDCSRAALERRLGGYDGPSVSPGVAKRKPQPLRDGFPDWTSYNGQRQHHRGEKSAGVARLRAKHTAEVASMRGAHRAERARILDRDWRGKGHLLNAMRSLLAAEHSKRNAGLQERHQQERADLRQRFPRFPDFEDWLCRQSGSGRVQQWRHHEGLPPPLADHGSRRQCDWEEIQSMIAEVRSGGDSSARLAAGQRSSGDREGAARAYERHLAELIREHRGGRRDASRIDLEVAIRMRVTGHARVDVQRAIEENASEMRPGERRDWKEYARRTVAASFGAPGDRQIERLAPSRSRWLRVEGRYADEPSVQPAGSDPEMDR